jgi:hypothetical protein
MNYHLRKALGDNETGFAGIKDATYRKEAWNFIMAGGALFNHLDYSFTTGNEDGTFTVAKGQPGGGSRDLRKQFSILASFMKSLNFISMKPVDNTVVKLTNEKDSSVRGLEEPERLTALYFSRKDTIIAGTTFEINLPAGSYSLTWIDTKSARETESGLRSHSGGWTKITTPDYTEDIALKLTKSR